MSDSYGDDQPYDAEPQPSGGSGSKVNVPTILASAGVAAVISALIVTIGVVGLATSDKFGNDSAGAQPTVVNLGSEQGGAPTTGQKAAAGTPTVVDPGTGETTAAPTENVPESDGDAGSGSGTQGQDNGTTGTQGTTQQTQQQAAPSPLTAGQLNTKVKTIMNTGASNSARADELEGGQKAMSSVSAVSQMLRVSGAGFTYKVVGPVTQNGETLNARLQMSLVGNGSRYLDLSWKWMDGKWKLSNQSVCAVAGYAMLPCSVG